MARRPTNGVLGLTRAGLRRAWLGSMDDWIAIGDLEVAINRARAALPALGAEASLTREVATLGALYGRLIWEGSDRVPASALSDGERIALALWLPPRDTDAR